MYIWTSNYYNIAKTINIIQIINETGENEVIKTMAMSKSFGNIEYKYKLCATTVIAYR